MERRHPLFADPTEPEAAAAYQVLAAVGITSDSSLAEVLEASYELLGGELDPDAHRLWNELRLIERRLLIDFFLYDLETGGPMLGASVAAVPPLPCGWLESLAYPQPQGREHAPGLPPEPAPFLGEPPSPWPSDGAGGEHG